MDMEWPPGASRNTAAGGSDQNFRGVDRMGVAPQAFQVVISSGRFGKNMHNKVAVIHENPFGGIIAFDADRKLSGLLQLLFNFVANGVTVARVRR